MRPKNPVMSPSPRSTSIRATHRVRPSVAMLLLLFLLAAPVAQAEQDRLAWIEALGARFEEPLFRPNLDWRAKGLAFIDLPLQIRARFDASFNRFRTRPDDLAAPIVSAVGPGLRFDRHIQSRVALTRPLARGVELEVVWETRNRIESGDPMAFGRQLVGAMIRFTP